MFKGTHFTGHEVSKHDGTGNNFPKQMFHLMKAQPNNVCAKFQTICYNSVFSRIIILIIKK
jgi:hypothetical protein